MKKLKPQEITSLLAQSTGWGIDPQNNLGITKEFVFATFLDSIHFVNELAKIAESLNHHPDILILYNKVRLSVYTHDAAGLTELDFRLAKLANALI